MNLNQFFKAVGWAFVVIGGFCMFVMDLGPALRMAIGITSLFVVILDALALVDHKANTKAWVKNFANWLKPIMVFVGVILVLVVLSIGVKHDDTKLGDYILMASFGFTFVIKGYQPPRS